MRNYKKLNLNDLKINSFITSLNDENSQTLRGGSSVACGEAALSIVVVTVAAGVAVIVAAKVVSAVAKAENQLKNYSSAGCN